MLRSKLFILLCLQCCFFTAQAQHSENTGPLVIVPAFGEVKFPNDEARLSFMIEEHDRDRAVAASRVNQKMKQGMEILRKEDPEAKLATRGYYSYPVYANDQPYQPGKVRVPVSWRVGQYLDMTTSSLERLPRTVAAAQKVIALNGLSFGLADATRKRLDEKSIAASYGHLTERIDAIARAMGRNPADAKLETIDFEASGAYMPQQEAQVMKAMSRASGAEVIDEPDFEPGEATLTMRVVGKVRFK